MPHTSSSLPMGSPIVISNVREHEVVPHPIVVLDGYVPDFEDLGLPPSEWFLDARLDAARGAFWPVTASGRFKALVLLPTPGRYSITLSIAGMLTRVFHIEYQPPVSRYVVRFYYQKCVDAHHEGFDAPPGVDNSDEVAMRKIRFNALLLQTATAEMFVELGLPRETFSVEFASDGLPQVYLLRSSFPNETARSIHDQELIKLVEKDIVDQGFDTHDEFDFKHAVILGCSKYNPETQHSDGHTALGGGKVGIFGSCGLHTWPQHLGEVSACCLNNQRIDTQMLMDDSGYRGTFWANFSTGIGAFIHELGHTFGLGHSTSGIMSRGFDDMTRLFCAYQPDHRSHEPGFFQDFRDGRLMLNHQALHEVKGPKGAHWNIGSALQLIHNPWISKRAKQSDCGPLVCWNSKVRGPVGQGGTSGTTRYFGSEAPYEPLGAVRISAGQYLDDLQTYTRSQVASLNEYEMQADGYTHWVLLAFNEYITHVEVRAGAWIDGLCIHTNLRSTQWYGGQGGQMHVLRPAEGLKINGFFGSRGDDFVGTLGVHCGSITELLEPHSYESMGPAEKVGPIGYAEQDGEQTPFDYNLGEELGAIFIKADDYVSHIKVYTRREFAAIGLGSFEGSGGYVFELDPDEYIAFAEVRAMCWVDAIRFNTNKRSSPWYGGEGGSLETLQPPPGFKINSFFGSIGNNFVGCIGAYCVPVGTRAHRELAPAEPTWTGPPTPFALLSSSSSGSAPTHYGVARGIVVAVQDDTVMYVSSFDSLEYKSQLAQDLQAFVYGGAQLYSFTFQPGEFLIQIDASLNKHHRSVEGLCFHTTTRCSSWFGDYSDSELYFIESPSGSVIKSIGGVPGSNNLHDIVGEFCARPSALEPVPVYATGDMMEDRGTYDIRIQSQSAFGIESVYLLKRRDSEHLEKHAWRWKSHPNAQPPQLWCVPQRMLERHIKKSPREKLFKKYAIGAMDAGGAYSMAACPPV